jgi:hypothetical protein
MLDSLGDLVRGTLGIYSVRLVDAFVAVGATSLVSRKALVFSSKREPAGKSRAGDHESVNAQSEAKFKIQIFKDGNN